MAVRKDKDGDQAVLLRHCAVTRIQRSRQDLIRFVLDPSGQAVPDLKCKLPGRGVWVTAARDTVEEACQRNVFARAFRQSVQVVPDMADLVGDLLCNEAMRRLSLANKAGLVVAGFTKVASAVGDGNVVVMMHAAEASDDGCRKLNRRYEAVLRQQGRQPNVITCFTQAQLSLALGRLNVVHAAVRDGGAAEKLHSAALQFQRYWAGRDAYEAA